MRNRATTNVIASSKKQDASLLSKITIHFEYDKQIKEVRANYCRMNEKVK